LENFRPGLYDLLLIDIAMPKMNGFELYDKIRELDKKVKISFVTASEMFYEEIRKEAFPEFDTTYCKSRFDKTSKADIGDSLVFAWSLDSINECCKKGMGIRFPSQRSSL
jgi:CheY-like chemotaxis protein